MTTIAKPTAAEMVEFDKWFDKYAAYFATVDDGVLQSAWWIHGRDSEEMAPPRKMAIWSAVNAAMQERGL